MTSAIICCAAWKVLGLECLGWDGEVNSMGPFVAANTDHFLYHRPEETGLKDGDKFGQAPDGGFPKAGGHEFDVRVSTLVKYQQAFQAAARFVGVVDELVTELVRLIR